VKIQKVKWDIRNKIIFLILTGLKNSNFMQVYTLLNCYQFNNNNNNNNKGSKKKKKNKVITEKEREKIFFKKIHLKLAQA